MICYYARRWTKSERRSNHLLYFYQYDCMIDDDRDSFGAFKVHIREHLYICGYENDVRCRQSFVMMISCHTLHLIDRIARESSVCTQKRTRRHVHLILHSLSLFYFILNVLYKIPLKRSNP